jgi:hypothetical protein
MENGIKLGKNEQDKMSYQEDRINNMENDLKTKKDKVKTILLLMTLFDFLIVVYLIILTIL